MSFYDFINRILGIPARRQDSLPPPWYRTSHMYRSRAKSNSSDNEDSLHKSVIFPLQNDDNLWCQAMLGENLGTFKGRNLRAFYQNDLECTEAFVDRDKSSRKLNENNSVLQYREEDRSNRHNPNEFRKPIWNGEDEDDDEDDFRRPPATPFGFRIFSDPLEIHKFFEHQMEEFMRSFSMLDNNPPAIFGDEMVPQEPQQEESLRDQFLKPGYKSADPGWSGGRKKLDQDLDDRISAGELDKILGERPSLESENSQLSVVPTVPGVQSRMFGQSVTSKTVRKPDGSVEIHRTVRDSQGNEETTVTRQRGDQSYTVTILTDPSGTEKRTENFYNLQEDEIDDFKKKWFGSQPGRDPLMDHNPKPHNWFPFDKFFRR